MVNAPFIYLNEVCKVYDNNMVIKQADLMIPRSGFAFLLGSTGAGKSTILKMISGEIKPTKGRVYIKGQDTSRWSKSQKAAWRRKIGYVFQEDRLLSYQTVFENVALPLEIQEMPRKKIKEKVRSILKVIGLGNRINAFPDQLSGGERQRVSLARALVSNPELIIADEPTAQLDPQTAAEIFNLLVSLNRTGRITILMATHEWDLVERTNLPAYFIKDGSLLYWEGTS
ncbi:MAG: ABC transporter ATP-binding protein [Firmicutes bacterium]|nr:ABC transporter ATP-binding protein [Bacillota bacterium]MDD4263651.1 ABC transporter ATP-binding protein [Bacillota bacterium]MDD4694212.1 ABC transporter ATP-binding protein [Bacillota bacterium]